MQLFKHQEEGIEFLLRPNGLKGKMLADDPGMGKTLQSLTAAKKYPATKFARNSLIICPASLKLNWEAEINKFLPDDRAIVLNSKLLQMGEDELVCYLDTFEWTIINYDLLARFNTVLSAVNWKVCILDESHSIKNQASQRSRALQGYNPKNKPKVKKYRKIGAEQYFLLSGTPMNRPSDLYNQLKIIDHPETVSWYNYALKYCNAKRTRFGLDTKGSKNLHLLRKRIEDCFLRRLKEDCLDLPEKTRQVIPVEIDHREYQKAWKEFLAEYKRNNKKVVNLEGTKFFKLREICAIAKVNSTIEIAESSLESGSKVIIFSCFSEPIRLLKEHFKNECVVIQGGMSAEEKQDAVNRFQNDPEVKVFIGGIKSAGTGLTLTAATHVLKNDWSFNPTDHLQSEDRAFRIGQKNAVLVTYISAKDTIDEKVEKIILPKFKAISKIVDGVDYQENEVMGELIKMIEDSLK